MADDPQDIRKLTIAENILAAIKLIDDIEDIPEQTRTKIKNEINKIVSDVDGIRVKVKGGGKKKKTKKQRLHNVK